MKNKTSNWPKNLLQWCSLALLVFFISGAAGIVFPKSEPVDPEALCPLGGTEALATYIQHGSLPCSMTTLQIMMGVALLAAVVLFGKLFCAYLCPIGTVEDLLIRLRKALKLRAIEIKRWGAADKILRIVKYALLFWIVYMTVNSSELFCKNLDPYYAVATGFKGEITLWMSIVSLVIVLLLGVVIDRFWCKYVCPLGAIATSFRFWTWLVLVVGAYWGLTAAGVQIPWWVLLGAMCLCGYLLEIFRKQSKSAPVAIIVDQDVCTHCKLCQRACPYGINPSESNGRVNDVDCMLCGECVAACPSQVLSVGCKKDNPAPRWTRFIPAVLAVVFVLAGYFVGKSFELPTIDVQWGVTEDMVLETVTEGPLPSVKCYGSSMAFKARMEKVPGVHGVKTFVGSHTVKVSYDPSATTEEAVRKAIFVPSRFRVNSPDPAEYDSVKMVTIRTEHMGDKLDLNRLGMQFRLTGRKIFGVQSEYDCPVIIRVYMAPDEELDAAWFKEIVEMKNLDMPTHDGKVIPTPLNFEFVRMEEGTSTISMPEYLHLMFDGFKAEFKKEVPEGQAQFAYDISDPYYEKPIIRNSMSFLSNHLSRQDGILGVYLLLNDSLEPTIRIRFTAPATPESIWERITMDTWTITYSEEDVRQVPAKIKFTKPGICKEI